MVAHTLSMASGIANVRFVGRGEELRALAAAYAEAEAGGASLVVVGGDAGVGKTRLLAEFTGGLDAMVLRGGCLPLGATGMPFSPIVEVLRRLTRDSAWPDRLPPALARLVPGLPADRWADRSTRQLLTFVVHALRSQPLLVVVTYRADDLHRQHPLRPLLAELRRNPRSRRIELSPFAPAEVAEYLAAATGSRPTPGPSTSRPGSIRSRWRAS